MMMFQILTVFWGFFCAKVSLGEKRKKVKTEFISFFLNLYNLFLISYFMMRIIFSRYIYRVSDGKQSL